MGKVLAFPTRLAVVNGGLSYPQRVPQYDDADVNDDEDGREAASCPQVVDERARYQTLLEEMADLLRRWGVCDAKRVLRDHDPVAVAWAITSVEEALATGEVRNPGGLFRWALRQGCNGL